MGALVLLRASRPEVLGHVDLHALGERDEAGSLPWKREHVAGARQVGRLQQVPRRPAADVHRRALAGRLGGPQDLDRLAPLGIAVVIVLPRGVQDRDLDGLLSAIFEPGLEFGQVRVAVPAGEGDVREHGQAPTL